MSRFCTHCKAELSDDSLFCKHCGKKIELFENSKEKIFCYNCGKHIPVYEKYCHFCGKEQIKNDEEQGISPFFIFICLFLIFMTIYALSSFNS